MIHSLSFDFMSILPSFIAALGSFLDSAFLYVAIIIPAFLLRNEKRYGYALLFVLFTMIDNYYLKCIFQKPLPPPLEGWAFPSGHMHSALIFWGWLACEYRRYAFTSGVSLILAIVAYGLVFHGYHYPIDILGAVGFGAVFLIVFHLLTKITVFTQKPYYLGFLLSTLGLALILLLPAESRKPHLWQALGALLGFSLGWTRSKTPIYWHSMKQKILQLVFTVSGCIVLWMGFNQLPLPSIEIKYFTQFFMIAAWFSMSKIILSKVLVKNIASSQPI